MWSMYFLLFTNINDLGEGVRFCFFVISLANLLCVSSIFDLFIGYDYVSQDIPQLYSGRTPQFYVPVS